MAQTEAAAGEPRGAKAALSRIFKAEELGILLVLIGLVVIVALIKPVFVSQANLINILRAAAFPFIIAIAMTYVFIGGQFDLSVGPIVALGGVASGMMVIHGGVPVPLAVIGTLILGAGIGFTSGFLVAVFAIPALIVTLGMLYAVRGVVLILTKGQPVYPLPPEFTIMGQGTLGPLPYPVVIGIVLAIFAHLVLKHTTYGRNVFAMGGNKETARLAGVRITRLTISVFMLTGMAAALAGMLSAARFSSATSNAGTGMELLVIASVIIGGTSLFGGAGSILGTAIGTLMMTVIKNAMVILRIDVYWQDLVVGIVIIAAVGLDQLRRRRVGL
ncbi:hypothetical protein ACMU_12195 [Actibacterium mucosum KCTC 23349]|uniref:ABC transporter permease n=1 Tax=Actibacterium mucosum KCTC 23349 TaxID=1454373 RepID=A0A037ZKX3_9RHOB|nr:ABC transporter permease [Actibacterium mucosum]KAJ55451.1 hypothetical protein ACMU_12195 [Actibacterium mucosum KCTC 23349]